MTLSVLSPETRLLMSTVVPEGVEGMVRAAQGNVDWSRFVRIADAEKASPVIWRRFYTTAGIYVPEPLATHLRRMSQVSDFNMLFLQQRLLESLDVLGAAGIPTMLLKGAALAWTVYPSFEARPMGDLDLLVPMDQVERAQALLEQSGWAAAHNPALEDFYREHHHLEPLADRRGTMATLEMHRLLFHVGHPFRFPIEDVWARARTVERAGRSLLVPSPADHLLHVSLHFAWSHMMRAGSWRAFRDVYWIIKAGFDWDEFLGLAEQTLATTSAYWTLRLARTVAGVPVPEEALRALRPPRPESTLLRLERHFAFGLVPLERGYPSRQLGNAMWEAAILPAWSGHGAARPWNRTDELLRATVSEDDRFGSRVRRSVARLFGWVRYSRAMVMPRRAARPPRSQTIGA